MLLLPIVNGHCLLRRSCDEHPCPLLSSIGNCARKVTQPPPPHPPTPQPPDTIEPLLFAPPAPQAAEDSDDPEQGKKAGAAAAAAGAPHPDSPAGEKWLQKWRESSWKMTLYTTFAVTAFSVSVTEPWFTDTREFWKHCGPDIPCDAYVSKSVLLFYCVEMGFYLQVRGG